MTESLIESDETTQAILAAALEQFGHHGFQATRLTAVAREAGVSRPTLYARFESKTELLRAVVQGLNSDSLERARQAAAKEDALEARLSRVVLAYYGDSHRALHGLPHIAELAQAHGPLVREITDKSEASLRALLLTVLPEDCGALTSKRALDLLVLSPAGLKAGGASPKVYQARLRGLATAVAHAVES